MKKKLLAWILTFVLAAAYIPTFSFAEGEQSGEESDIKEVLSQETEEETDDKWVQQNFATSELVQVTFTPQEGDDMVYNGNPKTPVVTVKFGDVTLNPDSYKVNFNYGDNINAGKAEVLIKLKGLNMVTYVKNGTTYYLGGTQRVAEFEISKRPVYASDIFKVNNSSLLVSVEDLLKNDSDYQEIYDSAKAMLERNMLRINKEYDGNTSSDYDTAYAAYITDKEGEVDWVAVKGTAVYKSPDVKTGNQVSFTPVEVINESKVNYEVIGDGSVDLAASISAKDVTIKPVDTTIVRTQTPDLEFTALEKADIEGTVSDYIKSLNSSNIKVENINGEEVDFQDAVNTVGTYKMTFLPESVEYSGDMSNFDVAGGSATLTVTGDDSVDTESSSKMGFVAYVDFNGVANISSIDTERLSEVGQDGNIAYAELDLTGLEKAAGAASFSWDIMRALFKKLQDNPFVLGLIIKTNFGEMKLDAQALGAITAEATTSGNTNIEIGFKEIGASNFTDEQNNTLEEYSVLKRYFAYIYSGREYITNLGGGYCTITIPYTVPEGVYTYKYRLFAMADNGAASDVFAYLDEAVGGWTFMTQALSKYALTYEKCDGGFLCPSEGFVDVKVDDWFHTDVDFALTSGIMAGTSLTTFSPEMGITRAMIVTILWRLQGRPASDSHGFIDLRENDYYVTAVNWAASKGIVSGYSAVSFGPDDKLTREQFAAILYRYAAYVGKSTAGTGNLSAYSDAGQVSDYAVTAMIWANSRGYITGTTPTTLDPQGTATRAQAAAILHRFI